MTDLWLLSQKHFSLNQDKIYRISRIALWILLVVNLLGFLAYSSAKQDSLIYRECHFIIEDAAALGFIQPESVRNELQDSLKISAIEGQLISKFSPSLLEHIVKANPFVEKAAAFTDVPGNLYINIQQKRPIGRVFNTHFDYYISSTGSKFPTSREYTARVPLVTGDFLESDHYADSMFSEKGKEVYTLLSFIDTSEYFKAFTDEILYYEGSSDLVLVPIIGDVEIVLGDVSDLSDKMNRLRVFYSKVLNSGTLYKYKRINLKFKHQVVCDLRDPVDTSNHHER